MEAVTDWRASTSKSTFGYAPSGVLKSVDLVDDIDGTFTHQPDGSIASLLWEKEASGADLRSHQSMTYDVGGLLESETVTITPAKDASSADSGGSARFEYDLAGRLDFWRSTFKPLEEDPSGVELSEHDYKLDDAGNILTEVVTADPSDSTTPATTAVSTTSSTYVDGRLDDQKVQSQARNGGLASTTSTDFAYTGVGDEHSRTTTITADGFSERVTRTSSYDAAGHTDEVSENGFEADPTLSYTYDGSDQLIARTNGSSDKRLFFYFLGTSHLAEETDAGGVTKVTYLNAVDGKALAEQKGSSWIWLLRDPKGSIATGVSASGDIKSQQAYDPYGAEELGGTTFATQQDEDDPSSLGFQGSHTDEASGNLLLGPRIYDPTIDRFTTADYFVGAMSDMQLGTDALTGNRYLFAAANPVAFFEDGHIPIRSIMAGIGAGAAALLQSMQQGAQRLVHYGQRLLHLPERLIRLIQRANPHRINQAERSLRQSFEAASPLLRISDPSKLKWFDLRSSINMLKQARYANLRLSPSTHPHADVVDQFKKTYDFVGQPGVALNWNAQNQANFLQRIVHHVTRKQGLDMTIVDLGGFSRSQAATVHRFVAGLPAELRARIDILDP